MAILYMVLFYALLNLSLGCPFNCRCSANKSTCTVIFNDDELDLGAKVLEVNGVLTPHHYVQLDKLPEMIKILHDCSCRSLRNCE